MTFDDNKMLEGVPEFIRMILLAFEQPWFWLAVALLAMRFFQTFDLLWHGLAKVLVLLSRPFGQALTFAVLPFEQLMHRD